MNGEIDNFMLETLQLTKTTLQNNIRKLYAHLIEVGELQSGQYKLRIAELEERLVEIDTKIADVVKTQVPELSDPDENIKVVRLFLASSAELKADRDQFEIFINRENNNLVSKGIFLRLTVWEDFLDAVSSTRLQDEYNKAIRQCDIFVSLFHTKTGRYTEEEFDLALETFKTTGKPITYTYFKNIEASVRNQDDTSLDSFKDKLRKLGHFPTSYNDIYDLKYQFKMQLEKIGLDKL
ncbi:hypothetical protein QWY86_16055 [Pedobacter aquatilis]|uniref:hypothetical protein n=1 Tax=Pedobacter aquatilis TaxID=351343 RepID=UPI0025B3D3AA|nr:hypothetical protein [Pedobacter aquatilis]MDN3588198.1 hypothetical protein [Pedobacter aquatilis]